VQQLARGIGLDKRIGPRFLNAGIGWGGSCFGKDTAALIATAAEYGIRMPLVEASREVNCRQRERVVEKLLQELKILKGRVIGILGLAFKPNTDDLRDSPALAVANRLVERGARLLMTDPVALDRVRKEFPAYTSCLREDPNAVFEGADAVVLATDWDLYRTLPFESLLPRMRKPVLLDGRNFLDGGQLEKIGFHYLGMGR
jgi:UDPglucose 6-dehydrogenase